MISKKSTCSWWPYLVSILLLSTVFSLLFGGYRSFIDYTKAIDPNLKFNAATLRFFTKEYIQRRYFSFVVSPMPEQTNIPSFRIYSDEQDLESLDSELPASGKTRFISGHIQVDKPSFSSEVQFRYRGGLPLHWLYEKKSLRVKLPPYTTYRGERQFNLVNPSTVHTVTDWISYEMSRSLGLLTPEYFPARVYINNSTNGLHFFLSRIDESFLRKNKRMPGSIYSGDTMYVPNPFGKDKTGYETVFKDGEGLPLIWKDPRLWDKGSARNAESKDDRRDIHKFLEVVNQTSPLEFMKSFDTYFDTEKYYLFWGLDTLVGSYHHDLFHNHKMYFDPYKGKFEPIEWDIRFWTNIFHIKDIALNPLLKQVSLNPVLEHERDLVTYSLMGRFSVEDIIKKVEQANNIIKPELAADPMRHAPDHRYGRFGQDKEVPFSMQEYEDAIEDLKLSFKNRQQFLSKILNYSKAEYVLATGENKDLVLTLSVNGNSAIDFDPWQLIPTELHANVHIYSKYLDRLSPVSPGKSEILYPGRVISAGNAFNRSDNRAILSYGKDKILWSPLNYQFLIRGLDDLTVLKVEGIDGLNAITGKTILVQRVDELASDEETSSIHPWELRELLAKETLKEISLSGELIVNKDLVYSKDQTVNIHPGTVFKLARGKSLVFYGKVIAEGRAGSPIVFKQLNDGEPWGSIIIQGENATGSRLSHIQVSGGSISSQQLIDYPGQLNIHAVDSFQLTHCLIKSNLIGDDALHVAYSKGVIKFCKFENTAFDALDMDIAEVKVLDSEFINIGNDALDLMTSKIVLANISIEGAGDKCISTGEESEVTIRNSRLQQCEIGIAIKDQSRAYVENIHFNGIRKEPIALYQKNPRYGKGGVIDGEQLFGINEKDIHLDKGSTSLIPKQAFVSNQQDR